MIKTTKISKDGKVTVTNKVVTRDEHGNEITMEVTIDPLTGKEITVKKTVKKLPDGTVFFIYFY